ncbi:pyruvate decarboxylase [Neoconidiobolus thromboides FSU 785]|nr:pyruvate decarboxylase [Neoconidiobolus thromboides FSU 785]
MKLSIGNFLLARLKQLGIDDIFGVPGDFNMEFLDLIEDYEGINWIGCCNELNASYAADGYSRVKGAGCVVTTFGVGELSAINGCAGSYSEMVKLIHIVGSPSIKLQKEGALLHHTFGNGNFDAFKSMYEFVSVDSLLISDGNDVQNSIDTLLKKCIFYSKPVYISLPTDICNIELEFDLAPINYYNNEIYNSNILNNNNCDNNTIENEILNEIVDLVQKSKSPVILSDACILRHNCKKEFEEFCNIINIPVVISPMGKGSFDENSLNYMGVFIGDITLNSITKEFVEKADLILSFGAIKSDFNTGGFSFKLPVGSTIEFHSNFIQVFEKVHKNYGMKELLPKLNKLLKEKNIKFPNQGIDFYKHKKEQSNINSLTKDNDTRIKQEAFWDSIENYLNEGDIVVADTGTSGYGILNIKFPRNAICITQFLWGSIGFSVGAAFGAAVAAKYENRRVVLFVGDGSFQLTAQELSTIGRNDLNCHFFIINNQGYTIERYIHGEKRKYNDIQNWQYSKALEFFNIESKGKSFKVDDINELKEILNSNKDNNKLNLYEIIMDKMDAPESLKSQAKLTAKANYE